MKYFIFDVDGTLIDSEQMYWNAFVAVSQKYGYLVDFHQFHQTFGKSMQDALNILGIYNNTANILKDWISKLSIYSTSIELFNGIEDMLKQLAKEKNINICVATSETQNEYQNNVSPLMLDKYFDAHVLSSEVREGKPAPDMLNLAIHKLNTLNKQCKKQYDSCIYIGDTRGDLIAAHAAGIPFGLAAWSLDATQKKKFFDADYFFEKPADVLSADL